MLNPSLAKGQIKPRARGWRVLLTHHSLRRWIQLAFAGFILVLMVRHTAAESSGAVSAAPEAYCPFGGLETLYRYIAGGGTFVSHTHLSNVVMLVAVLVTAFLLRSAFCGWICPLGFFQDLISGGRKFLAGRFPRFRRAFVRLQTRLAPVSAVADRYLRLLKYSVLVWAVWGAAAFGYMVFRDYDPWSAFINIAEMSFTPGLIVLGITLGSSFFVERPWCRYACPLGAVSGLVGKLSPVYLKRQTGACKVCKVCTTACPMGLPVHTATVINSVDCIACLECVGACPREGALEVRVGVPLVGRHSP